MSHRFLKLHWPGSGMTGSRGDRACPSCCPISACLFAGPSSYQTECSKMTWYGAVTNAGKCVWPCPGHGPLVLAQGRKDFEQSVNSHIAHKQREGAFPPYIIHLCILHLYLQRAVSALCVRCPPSPSTESCECTVCVLPTPAADLIVQMGLPGLLALCNTVQLVTSL